MEYQAELELPYSPSVGSYITGYIFNDSATHGNHPFRDATPIYTSTIQDIVVEEDAAYIITRNTVYKLI